MTTLYPSLTTQVGHVSGKERPALSLNFVTSDIQIARRPPEELAEWIAKEALRNLTIRRRQLLADDLDTDYRT